MVVSKRGQFFLLAAVIISVIIISLGAVSNRVIASREGEDMKSLSYDVKREAGAVLDYQIYSNFSNNANLSNFVDLLATDIMDKDPDANFMFIYGNNDTMYLRNFGDESAYIQEEEFPGAGAGAISTICYGSFGCMGVNETIVNFIGTNGSRVLTSADMSGSNNVSVFIEGNEFVFPISRHKQVVFLAQREVDDEVFVSVK